MIKKILLFVGAPLALLIGGFEIYIQIINYRYHSELDYKNAIYRAEKEVLKRLRSPTTAEFNDPNPRVDKINDTAFVVKSYVDASNAFGAIIRNNYTCTLSYHRKAQYTLCENIEIY